ncbi:sugar phosphate isomerase/epimerase family protein [Chitinolyticbacter meiyuanensis]|uniref:sugar phosphate isomerase/epimerase family protein n=1 Tax=Chitinolyticbacter meiyuanensis TaxID=682798 RepID=UPI0011E5EC95|nr:sugar phosphate isomerase/epimerase family protein [Chitinolyticbacter meiyuanensis]
MNPLGIHALVWAGNLAPEAARKVIGQSKAAGYDVVELSLHEPASMDVGLIRDLLRQHDLKVACSRGLAFDADVSSEDAAVVARGVALLEQAVQLTHDLGGSYFGGVPYSALGKYGHPVSAAGRRNVVQSLKRLADFAGNRGVTIGIEVVNRYESNVINTARQALALIDEVGAPNLVVHLDTYHMNIEEADFVQPVLECGERLGYVHIGESHRGYLGSGTIDFTAFFHALAMIRYAGPITFESFSSAVVAQGLSNDLAVWRNLWDDGMDLATHARSFMLAQAKGAGLGAR